jgi:hypothetical protein
MSVAASCDVEPTALDLQLLSLLRDSIPAGCLSDEDLLRQARALQQAPSRSYVRVNVSGVAVTDLTAFVHDRAAQLQQLFERPWCISVVPECPHVLCISPPPSSLTAEPRPAEPARRRVIVHLACALAVMRGANVFAPGVLAVEERADVDIDPQLVSVWADVQGACLRGHRDFSGAVRFLGNGQLRIQRHELFGSSVVKGVAVEMTALAGLVQSLPSFHDLPLARFFPQNLPCSLVAASLDLSPDFPLSILDMCASPGGKTSHLAMLAGPEAHIVACDKNKGKVAKLQTTLASMGFDRIDCRVQDATRPDLPAASFDRILLDPPCSGFGQRPVLSADIGSVASWASNSQYDHVHTCLCCLVWGVGADHVDRACLCGSSGINNAWLLSPCRFSNQEACSFIPRAP